MDGKGAWRDNVFVERLWRSVKYEEVYLKAYDTVAEARASLGRYLDFFNRQRPHSSLDRTHPGRGLLHPATLRGGRMKFPPPHRGWTSGRATPSLRPNPYAARSTIKPGRTPLIDRGNCPDNRSQLSPRASSSRVVLARRSKQR